MILIGRPRYELFEDYSINVDSTLPAMRVSESSPCDLTALKSLPSARCFLLSMLSSTIELTLVCLAVWLVSVVYRQWILARDTLRDIG